MKAVSRAWSSTLMLVMLAVPCSSRGKSTSEIFREGKDSVVLLIACDKASLPAALGSGFFVETNVIASNYHVVEGASSVRVTLLENGKTVSATRILGYSKNLDVVLLEVPCDGKPVRLGSATELQVGDKVAAIGNPKGLTGTVSEGIISALRQNGEFNILQITAPISPGSSGGPLFNADGAVVGITTFTVRDSQNLNFAVPTSVLKKLDRSGKPWEPDLSQPVFREEKGTTGVVFTHLSFGTTEVKYSLKNTTDNAIRNVDFLVVFRLARTGEIIHYQRCLDKITVLPHLAKLQTRLFPELEGFSSYREYNDRDRIYTTEFRLLSYDIAQPEESDVSANGFGERTR